MKYVNLFLMSAFSFISMYILMYMMVDSYANVYSNLNQFYMAGIMTIPMIIIELFLIMSSSIIFFVTLIFFIRKQTAISDKEFLKSMIPHHGAAILMCEQNSLQDPEIKELCKNIMITQKSEIDFMKAKLNAIK